MARRLSVSELVIRLILVLFSLSILWPFVYLIALSLSTAEELMRTKAGLFLWPQGFTWDAYAKFLKNDFVYTGYLNTIMRTAAGVVFPLLVMGFAAYPLSKPDFPNVKIYTGFIIFTMFFSGGLIPQYLLFKKLGLLDNRLVFILPGLVSTFSLLIIRNFFTSLPASLEEAAKIDGANEVTIFFNVVIPLSTPIFATVALWQAVDNWNAWFDSMIYISTTSKHVIAVHVRRLVIEQSSAMMESMINTDITGNRSSQSTEESMRAAAIMVTAMPIIVVYPFLQRYFVKGVIVGSIKG